MAGFELVDTVLGVPLFYNQVEMLKSASIYYVVYSGCSDETDTNSGVARYLEHMPGKGTKSFPNGQKDTKGPIVKFGGKPNAYTQRTRTAFYCKIPARKYELAIKHIGSCVTEPLLRKEEFENHRSVMLQTRKQSLDKTLNWGWHHLQECMTPGHPLAKPILGTEKSLTNLTYEALIDFYETHYSRSRLVIVGAGPQSADEFVDLVRPQVENMPDRDVSERRQAAIYGPADSWSTETSILDYPFKTSVVNTTFLVDSNKPRDEVVWSLLTDMFAGGGISSPLLLKLREELGLVYSGKFLYKAERDFTRLNLTVETKQGDLDKIIDACWEVLSDSEVMTGERFETVQEMARGAIEMKPIDPDTFCIDAVNSISQWGRPISADDRLDMINSVTFAEVQEASKSLARDLSKTVIFKGQSE